MNMEQIAEMITQQAFGEKYANNLRAGLMAMATGEYSLFEKRDKKKEERVGLFLLLPDNATVARINERVVDPLVKLAEKYGISAIFSGKEGGDLPPHITLDRMNLREGTKVNWGKIVSAGVSLKGLVVPIDRLIMSPNTIICSSFHDEPAMTLERVRREIEKECGGLYPFRFDDILYTSVMRIKGRHTPDVLLPFALEADRAIGKSIRDSAIDFKVEGVFAGTSYDFMKQVDYQHVI